MFSFSQAGLDLHRDVVDGPVHPDDDRVRQRFRRSQDKVNDTTEGVSDEKLWTDVLAGQKGHIAWKPQKDIFKLFFGG